MAEVFSEELRPARARAGLTQEQLARADHVQRIPRRAGGDRSPGTEPRLRGRCDVALQTDGLMARLDRQSIHTREDPPMPMLWFVIDEAVLIRPIGGRQVMQEQTGRLIEASLLPKVVLQVIQLGSGRTRDCPASSR